VQHFVGARVGVAGDEDQGEVGALGSAPLDRLQ
jgi:hypothetical protein